MENTAIALLPDLPETPVKYNYTLVNLRKEAELTQHELAAVLGVSYQSVAFWETGRRKPTLESLQKYADHFKVGIDFLLEDAYTVETAKQIIAEQVTLIHNKGLDITKADRLFLLQVIKILAPQILVEEKITQRVGEDGQTLYERAIRKLELYKEKDRN